MQIKRGCFAVFSIASLSWLGAQTGCARGQEKSAVQATTQVSVQPSVTDTTEAMRSTMRGMPGVITWDQIPTGQYLLASYKQTVVHNSNHKEVMATYLHRTRELGKLDHGDTVRVTEQKLPPSMGYSASLSLALPLQISATGTGLATFRNFVFYEPDFSHGPSDANPYWTWYTHANASRGFNFLSVCREELRVAGEGQPFYRGFFQGFSEEHGSLFGWVQKRPNTEGVITVNVYFAGAAHGATLVSAEYVDAVKITQGIGH